MMRLNHFLSAAGVYSRRSADIHIQKGNVRVDGIVTRMLGIAVDESQQLIEVKQRTGWVRASLPESTTTYAINKPAGFTATVKDWHAQKTVLDLVPSHPHVVPAGRLDKNTEGLMILTNDGELTNRLTHPRNHIDKTYVVTCNVPKTYQMSALSSNLRKLASGVMLDDQITYPAQVKLLKKDDVGHTIDLSITIHEGRNKQVRRMVQKIGLNVIQLTRQSIGKLTLQELNLGLGKNVVLNQTQIKKLLE